MKNKCGLTIDNKKTNLCKECIYDGFEKKEECYDRQMRFYEEKINEWIKSEVKENETD